MMYFLSLGKSKSYFMEKYWKQIIIFSACLILLFFYFPSYFIDYKDVFNSGYFLFNKPRFFYWIFIMILFLNIIFSGIAHFGKNEKERFRKVLDVLGSLIVVFGFFYILPYLFEIFIAWYFDYIGEQLEVFQGVEKVVYFLFNFLMGSIFILPLFFISKKWRLNSKYSFWISSILFILYLIESNFERIYIDVVSFFR